MTINCGLLRFAGRVCIVAVLLATAAAGGADGSRAADPPPAGDESRVLRAEIRLLKAAMARQKKRLAALERENAKLRAKLAAAGGEATTHAGSAQPAGGKAVVSFADFPIAGRAEAVAMKGRRFSGKGEITSIKPHERRAGFVSIRIADDRSFRYDAFVEEIAGRWVGRQAVVTLRKSRAKSFQVGYKVSIAGAVDEVDIISDRYLFVPRQDWGSASPWAVEKIQRLKPRKIEGVHNVYLPPVAATASGPKRNNQVFQVLLKNGRLRILSGAIKKAHKVRRRPSVGWVMPPAGSGLRRRVRKAKSR